MVLKADDTLDCIGLYCPMPIVNTAGRLKQMAPGQVLEVLADDEGIKEDMPSWCRATGNEFLGLEEEAGQYRVYVKKSAND
jgi:tRNA 2-thiouridine synthesizing protein A